MYQRGEQEGLTLTVNISYTEHPYLSTRIQRYIPIGAGEDKVWSTYLVRVPLDLGVRDFFFTSGIQG